MGVNQLHPTPSPSSSIYAHTQSNRFSGKQKINKIEKFLQSNGTWGCHNTCTSSQLRKSAFGGLHPPCTDMNVDGGGSCTCCHTRHVVAGVCVGVHLWWAVCVHWCRTVCMTCHIHDGRGRFLGDLWRCLPLHLVALSLGFVSLYICRERGVSLLLFLIVRGLLTVGRCLVVLW